MIQNYTDTKNSYNRVCMILLTPETSLTRKYMRKNNQLGTETYLSSYPVNFCLGYKVFQHKRQQDSHEGVPLAVFLS